MVLIKTLLTSSKAEISPKLSDQNFSSYVLHEGSSVQFLDAVIDVEEQLLLSLVLDVGHNWTTKLYQWG